MAWGLDYSFARPPYPAWLTEKGFTFVVRYLCWDNSSTHGKILFKDELDALRAAGIDVVLNWEYTGDLSGGYGQGQQEAQEAARQADNLGAADAPIYFSKDVNTPPQQADADYLNGVAAVIGRERTGLYGSRAMVIWAASNGLATYRWQNVWGSPPWEAAAQMWQYTYNDDVGFGGVDRDQATTADFGQIGGHVPPVVAASTVEPLEDHHHFGG